MRVDHCGKPGKDEESMYYGRRHRDGEEEMDL
jgi:hypothetical protein